MKHFLLSRRYSTLDLFFLYGIVKISAVYGAWCLLLVIPSIIISVSLENYFLKNDK